MNTPAIPPAVQADPEQALKARAEKRVNMKLGLYTHAAVFVVVNLGLYLFSQLAGRGQWHIFPLWGWGLGLAIHALVTVLSLSGDGVRDRMLAQEEARLRERR